MSEQERFAKITYPTGAVVVVPEGDFYNYDFMLGELEAGDEYTIELVEMTQDEFDALDEFEGP